LTTQILAGDCVEVMASMPGDSVDAVVCDPPYFLCFMGKTWGHAPSPKEMQVQHETWAREAFRVLKPGSFILCAGGTRTYHRLDSGARQLTSLLPSTSAPCGVSC
jgi:DNA modification methylase